jgi:Tfp pilus assembly ATPase PilU
MEVETTQRQAKDVMILGEIRVRLVIDSFPLETATAIG